MDLKQNIMKIKKLKNLYMRKNMKNIRNSWHMKNFKKVMLIIVTVGKM